MVQVGLDDEKKGPPWRSRLRGKEEEKEKKEEKGER
jgi:hypothetical protein